MTHIVHRMAVAVVLGCASTTAAGSDPVAKQSHWAQARPQSVLFKPGVPTIGGNSNVVPIDQCGATEYSCDDYGSPDCRWDNSIDRADNGDWFCAPYNVVHCAVRYEWDYWCESQYYCCNAGCCQ